MSPHIFLLFNLVVLKRRFISVNFLGERNSFLIIKSLTLIIHEYIFSKLYNPAIRNNSKIDSRTYFQVSTKYKTAFFSLFRPNVNVCKHNFLVSDKMAGDKREVLENVVSQEEQTDLCSVSKYELYLYSVRKYSYRISCHYIL